MRVTYNKLFGSYLAEAQEILVTDHYIRIFFQIRNLMELMETILKQKPKEEEVKVHLITPEDESKADQQREYLEKISSACATMGINFYSEFALSGTIHAWT